MIEKEEINIGILYLAFHNSLKKVHKNRIVTKEDLYIKLGRQYLVPRCLREIVVCEFEALGLIKREEKDIFRILDVKINIEEESGKIINKKIYTIKKLQ